jgi:ATP-dependent Clp protease adaptor protein ClpS
LRRCSRSRTSTRGGGRRRLRSEPRGPGAPVGHNEGVTSVTEAPADVEVERPLGEDEPERDRPWIVIVWNDPVNLMSYVTFVFQKLFGYSREKATRLMLQVHHEGKAVVSSGARERAEHDVARLHAHGLWATMRQD